MKLSTHQEKIVEAIILGKVYDIPSYLDCFNKSHNQQYDFDHLQTVFEKCENSRKYIFKQNSDGNYYTQVYDCEGTPCEVLPVSKQATFYFKEYPIESPVKAYLTTKIDVEKYTYDDKTYIFNFLEHSYPVADSFSDIIDFIILWSHLKKEALILEVNKPITDNDISVFFESEPQEINPNTRPSWVVQNKVISEATETEVAKIDSQHLPFKDAKNYLNQTWKLNEDHLLMCEDFINKKIIPSSQLQFYKQKRFRTVEQVYEQKNLFIARIAVIISVISVLIGNILPLFQPQETDYLSSIYKELSALENNIEDNNLCDELVKELKKTNELLDEIKEKLTISTNEHES